MRTGDLLLIQSKIDPLAWLICLVTKSKWNHVAWAIDNEYLIEARGRAISICPLTKYLNQRYKIKLIRLNDINEDQLKEGIDYILQFKGKRNYFKYLKTLIRMLFLGNDSRRGSATCSSLIASGLEEVFYYFIPPDIKDTYLITPEDISNSNSTNVSHELK